MPKKLVTNTQLEIGEFIGVMRRRQKMTISELAEKAGVHRNYVSHIEAGTANMSLSTLIGVVEALGYSLNIRFKDKDSEQ